MQDLKTVIWLFLQISCAAAGPLRRDASNRILIQRAPFLNVTRSISASTPAIEVIPIDTATILPSTSSSSKSSISSTTFSSSPSFTSSTISSLSSSLSSASSKALVSTSAENPKTSSISTSSKNLAAISSAISTLSKPTNATATITSNSLETTTDGSPASKLSTSFSRLFTPHDSADGTSALPTTIVSGTSTDSLVTNTFVPTATEPKVSAATVAPDSTPSTEVVPNGIQTVVTIVMPSNLFSSKTIATSTIPNKTTTSSEVVSTTSSFHSTIPVASLPTAITTLPATSSISDATFAKNLATAQEYNNVFVSLNESSPCTKNSVACINGKTGTCDGGRFSLARCATGTACFALPMDNADGVYVGCADIASSEKTLGLPDSFSVTIPTVAVARKTSSAEPTTTLQGVMTTVVVITVPNAAASLPTPTPAEAGAKSDETVAGSAITVIPLSNANGKETVTVTVHDTVTVKEKIVEIVTSTVTERA